MKTISKLVRFFIAIMLVLYFLLDGLSAQTTNAKKKLIISAHGNSLRALVKYLDGISDEDIPNLNIPTGVPLVYELDNDLKAIKSYYLKEDGEEVRS